MPDVYHLQDAKRNKKDEFYTQLVDIEKELRHYKKYFKDKIVYCNCDDPFESNFFKYFASNFNALGLKRLLVTSYAGSPIVGEQMSLDSIEGLNTDRPTDRPNSIAHKLDIKEVYDLDDDGAVSLSDVKWLLRLDDNVASPLRGNGDFRSQECIQLLRQADIVVTNPPFSLFREYLAQLVNHNKKFLIIGNLNALVYKETFPLIAANKLWLGPSISSGDREFRVPEDYPLTAASSRIDEHGHKYIRVKGVRWFTNLDHKKRHEPLILVKKYTPEAYPKYDNYDAINVDKTKDIPEDYSGVMGVPITFLDKWNPDQFEVVDGTTNPKFTAIDGQPKYARLFIRRR